MLKLNRIQGLGVIAVAAVLTSFVSCREDVTTTAPVAKVSPKRLEKHGHVRTDNYFWLRDRENPETIAYLEAENRYTETIMASTEGLQSKIFNEFKTRIKQTDISVPFRKDDYYHYTRTEDGKQYPVYCRKRGTLESAEEITVDVNEVARGHDFCAVLPPEFSPRQDLIAYGADTAGRRFYTIHFKNAATGEELKDVIPDVTGSMAWANDNRTLFYAKQDPLTLRSNRIYRHVLGTDHSRDELVFEEKDETYRCFVFKTRSKRYIMIASRQTLATEYRYLDANKPGGEFRMFLARQRDHEYRVDHYQDYFYVRTNHEANNFRLMKTPVGKTSMEFWEEVIPHRDDVLLEGADIFKDHLVVSERKGGLRQIRVIPWSGTGEHYLEFGEPAYEVSLTDNYEFDTPIVRFKYSSLTTPPSVYDYNMGTREKKLLKQEEVLGGFDSKNYQTERLNAVAKDGTQVPISLVYRRGFQRDGTSPLLIYGYGSYGATREARFSPFLISLLDRGFVYAIAHIRGGQELGRQWYEDGKLLRKMNTFTDFIDCAEHLIREKYGDPDRMFAMGASAGGLLMGAVMNLRPELFNGVVAQVPWVDIVTTMLDEDIPLTTNEYDEWGNPNEKQYYDYMLSYSPYDQVGNKNYPNLLVTTALQDSQVQYWEPAKWVAKLRAMKSGNSVVLLKTEMQAGHGGVSGRDQRYRETAFDYAFLLSRAGIQE